MRVLHVLPTCDFTGPANVCFEVCRGLTEAGVAAHILSLRPAMPAARDCAQATGVPVTELQMGGFWDRSVVAPLRQAVADLHPDVVHGHGLRPDTLVAPLARQAGVPRIVSTVHNSLLEDYTFTYGSRALAMAMYLWQRRGLEAHHDAVVFICEAARRHVMDRRWAPLRPRCARVILNGRHVPTFEAARAAGPARDIAALRQAGVPLVGCVGRLSSRKNMAMVVRAVAELRGLPCRLVLVGAGEDESLLRDLVQTLGLGERVVFLGQRDDVPRVLAGLDILALSSHVEGTPLAVVEAMLSGLAVVATAVGGVPEVIRDGETGLLAPPGDQPAFTQQLGRLAADPDLRARLGEAARDHARTHLSAQAMTAQYLRLYQELLDQKR